MPKKYVIWWHSKFIDEIDRHRTTIREIVETTQKTVVQLKKLQRFEDAGQIKIQVTGSLNPICIEIVDPSVEGKVARNPLVEQAP
ncbi:MAG: hypothetical protein JXA00_02350 [Candidatus Thermoplasmatota archaeon]|nr:hypothetical protein [Candidatus Thermoplasmatota archaeon]